MATGTRPKIRPLPVKPTQAEKAAKAAKLQAEREAKKAEKAAAKAVNDAKKAAEKAKKDAVKAEAKTKRDAEKAAAKAAKAADTKSSAKSAPAAKTKTTKITKVAKIVKVVKVAKAAKAAKVAKTTKKAKAAKRVGAATVQPRANQYGEDGDDDEEKDGENEEHQGKPQAKRRRIETSGLRRPYVEVSAPKAKRPAFQIGEWDYMMKTYIPKGLENENNRPLPHIYIGGTAPQPRWVITQNETIQLPTKRGTDSNASPGSRERWEFGGLQWTFEEGDFQKWTGLEYPALYELAFLCLEYTLTDTNIREQVYDSLAKGPLPKEATEGDRWYPALPPIPITRHFVTGSTTQTSRKSSDASFYFGSYERPNMAARPRDERLAQLYPQAVASSLYNRPTFERWPTAPRSASPDPESEDGSEEDQSVDSSTSMTGEPYLERNPEDTFSEPTETLSLQNEQSTKQNIKQDVEQDSEDGQSARSRVSSVSGELDLELIQEGTYSEPTTPVSLGNDEKNARLDKISEDGSIFGDGDDSDDNARVEPNSARDSREQSPNSIFSGSGSDSEVSASSKTGQPGNLNVADDNSAQPTNSLTPVYHDGLFSPGQIERYYSERKRVFEQERLGGLEHHEAPERNSQAQPSPNSKPDISGQIRATMERRSFEREGLVESSKRSQVESPSAPSPPATRRKTTAEIGVDNVMSFAEALQQQRNEMRAAAAEKISDKPPVALLKKATPNRAGARSQADAPSPEILPNLQDKFLEQTKAYLNDPIQRARHFPDPLAVRRVRVWAGEELVGHEIKPAVDAILPPWAERHRPFTQWQDPVSASFIELFKNHANHNRLDWDNSWDCGAYKGLEMQKAEQGTK
ncbi:hypothetical protein N7447_001174 [Penicillium robsamsonii]|uniref:uncharacterized protein n=1 Tax=Penicillium robsamsonii TaxID=1792511 RepID=UPI002548B146|nr:uncharacterized protein N7447_001174 [Penicillium robsamsonii]KAJ5835148.1 hypothetical protein N7447_001174 [Penicillium robsamsonii]